MLAPSRILTVKNRKRAALAGLAFGLLVAGTVLAAPAEQVWDDGTFSARSEGALVALTNLSRVSERLAPLDVDPRLTAIARWRSQDMAIRGYFSHAIPPGGGTVFETIQADGYCFTLAGENIGWNTHPDSVATDQIQRAFLASPGHRGNVLGQGWNAIGVGAWKAQGGRKLWTVLFADACGDVMEPRLGP
ncbi:MAG TPA: CAP domain-containing protein [Candidatus Limnocylindrales bacterium]|nr:CAP domain-containing protein [Candidatus Limnocylindrales bacterium]